MYPKTLAGRALLLGASLFLLASYGARADDPTAVEYIPGFWAGFSQSSLGPGPINQSFFDIVETVRHRQFRGGVQVALGDGSVRFLCDGSVSNANVMNVQGISGNGALILVMHGRVRASADGSVHLAALQYEIDDLRGGLVDQGFMLLLQRFGGTNWANPGPINNITGRYDGMYQSSVGPGGGCIMGDFAAITMGGVTNGGTLTSGFLGRLEIESSDGAFDSFFDIQGTLGLPAVQDGTSNTFIIGADTTHGIIAVLIGLLVPAVQTPDGNNTLPAVQGNYFLFRSLADVFASVWRGQGTGFFDMGTFNLPAVQ